MYDERAIEQWAEDFFPERGYGAMENLDHHFWAERYFSGGLSLEEERITMDEWGYCGGYKSV